MALDLPENLYSPEQLKACVFEVEKIVAWRRRQDIKKQADIAITAPDFALSRDLVTLLGPIAKVAEMTAAQLENCQKQLHEWISQPVTHVTFAAPPPVATKVEMVQWFRKQVAPTALLKFHVNGNIVGGMVVRTPTKIFDFSFRRQLLRRKSLIPEIFKRV